MRLLQNGYYLVGVLDWDNAGYCSRQGSPSKPRHFSGARLPLPSPSLAHPTPIGTAREEVCALALQWQRCDEDCGVFPKRTVSGVQVG